MRPAHLLWTALLWLGCVPSFDAFRVVDDAGRGDASARDAGAARRDAGNDAGPRDSGPNDSGPGDGGPSDGGPGDAGDAGPVFVPTRLDTECAEVWSEGACPGRAVYTVAMPFLCDDLALAREDDGDLVAFFNAREGADIGRIRTERFNEATPDNVIEGPSIDPVSAIGDVVGTDLGVTTEAPDTHHLAYWLRSDFGHEVRYRRLQGNTFSPPQTLADGVGAFGVVDIELDRDGQAVIAWHDDVSGENASRWEASDGSFLGPNGLRRDGDTDIAGAGAMALHAGSTGQMHAAYQWGATSETSSPSYNIGTRVGFSSARTLDNPLLARASGIGVELTLLGDEVVVAYLDWNAGVGEVRLARFVGGEPIRTEVHLRDLVIPDLPGDYPIVIDTDPEGLLSMLVADAGRTLTRLQWHRQTRLGGTVRWLVDTIAVIGADAEYVHVDMVLGPDRRPHILYWDAEVGAVRYATALP